MLAQVLAVVVGLGSVALYMAAFFFPEVHRRHDFFWSGVGLFYALVLWFCATQVTATEYLGHLASVSLLGWLGWQTLNLRRKRTPVALQTPYSKDSWPTFWRELKTLIQDFLRQTPLGQWLPTTPSADSAHQARLRASALKDVGYEFLDDVESSVKAAPKAPVLSTVPQALERALNPTRPSGSPTSSSQVRQPSSNRAEAIPSAPSPKTWWQRTQVVVAWTGELVSSMTAPKPKKPILEIPPRESSIKPKSPGSKGSDHPDSAPDMAKAAATGLHDLSSTLPQSVSIVEAQSSAPVEASALESGTSSNNLSPTEALPQLPLENGAANTETDQPAAAEPGELIP